MKIEMAHDYMKLLDHNNCPIDKAKLLEVLEVKIENLSKYFINYDTDNERYQLQKSGKFLLLIFQKSAKDIFTTLREYTPEKIDKYKNHIGEIFDIEVKDNS